MEPYCQVLPLKITALKWQGLWMLAKFVLHRLFCFLVYENVVKPVTGSPNNNNKWHNRLRKHSFFLSLSLLLTCPFGSLYNYKWPHFKNVPLERRHTIIAIQSFPPYHLQMLFVISPLSCSPMHFLIQNVSAGIIQSEGLSGQRMYIQ